MKIIIKLLIAILCISLSNKFYAQSKIDSLKKILHREKSIENKIDLQNDIANIITYENPDSAMLLLIQNLKLAKNKNYSKGIADALNKIGVCYDMVSKIDSANYYYQQALPIYQAINNKKGIGSIYNNIGLLHWNKLQLDSAAIYFTKALGYFEEEKIDKYIANALNNLGLVYIDLRQERKAISYFLKAKIYYEKINDQTQVGSLYNNLSNVYESIELKDSSLYFANLSIVHHRSIEDNYGLSIAYMSAATVLFSMQQFEKCPKYFDSARILKEKIEDFNGLFSLYFNWASYYEVINKPQNELENLMLAKVYLDKNPNAKKYYKFYEALKKYHTKQKNYALAIKFSDSSNFFKDSISQLNITEAVNNISEKYNNEKHLRTIDEQQNKLTQKNNLLIFASFAALALSGLFFAFYRNYKLKKEKEQQTIVLEQKELATKAVLQAEENERVRIAKDLHDGVGQLITASKFNLESIDEKTIFKNENDLHSFIKAKELITNSGTELRSVAHNIMPNVLLKSGLADALRNFINSINNDKLNINLYTSGINESIDKNTELILYRVVQECVNNVIKHANANVLSINFISEPNQISITIEDNGTGFDTNEIKSNAGIGLQNIKSRVQFLKGEVYWDSSIGNGTFVSISIPK